MVGRWSEGSKINRGETGRERGDQTSHQTPLWSIKLSYLILSIGCSVLTFSHERITNSVPLSLWSSKCIKGTEPYFWELTCCDVGITDLKQPLDLKWYININITFEPKNGSHNSQHSCKFWFWAWNLERFSLFASFSSNIWTRNIEKKLYVHFLIIFFVEINSLWDSATPSGR